MRSLGLRLWLLAAWISGCGALKLMMQTPGRVALVTGANKGIGKEIAKKLGKVEGLTTILGCRSLELGAAATAELSGQGCKVVFKQVDLADPSTIEEMGSFVSAEYGKLDILVNNAAICFNDPTLYGKVPHTPFEQQADITIRTNFDGTVGLTEALLPSLKLSDSARVVNVASSAGRLPILKTQEKIDTFTSEDLTVDKLKELMKEFVKDVEAGNHAEKGWPNTCYGMSKLGIIAHTRIMARAEPSIMFNTVDPGYCATDQNANQGFRAAEMGAETAVLLATIPPDQFYSGMHWYDNNEIPWSYR